MAREHKLELRSGKTVIADVPVVEMEKLQSLVAEMRAIRDTDTLWEEMPPFDEFDAVLSASGIALVDTFDVYEDLTVWNVMPNGDSVRITKIWNKGY